MHRRRNASALPWTQVVRSREAVRALRDRTRDASPCAVRCAGDRSPAEPHEPQAGSLRARARRGSGLTEANSSRDAAGLRVRKLLRSNPERTDSPTHIRPGLSADPDPLHLAAAVAALDQDLGGGARVGRIAVSPVEQALVGLGILSGVSTPGGRPLQLGVRRDRLAGAAATGARCRTSGRTSDPWWHRERTRRRPLWIGWGGHRP